MVHKEHKKPIVGFTTGDVNGIGLETIVKVLMDNRIFDLCTPVLFASNKVVNFYRKGITEHHFNFNNIKDFQKLSDKQINIYTCWDEEVNITPGELNEIGGQYAITSLVKAVEAAKNGDIDILVTAPIHKKNVQSAQFSFSGHTPYLQHIFGTQVLMLMTAVNLKVALVTEHVPVKEVHTFITKEGIYSKLQLLEKSLMQDFGIDKPKIAVLGLNPHMGDEGLVGKEEQDIITPAIMEYKNKSKAIVKGPYSADAFFAQSQYTAFDAVLAMYHDQGLIPFKSLTIGEGVNYTAGLPIIRTSPDHGVAFDIAGKNLANHESLLEAIYTGIDILNHRKTYAVNRANPLRKMSKQMLANAIDEAVADENE
jgi:4-phospho-D-threonate 3-dehydrogenase / 4-phospho-D-erythronate 3-dehydrogenase